MANKSKVILIGTAITITAVAASFSLPGLGKLFPGAAISAMALGGALEAAKLVTASLMCRGTLPTRGRLFAAALVAVGMAVNVLGVFGYLSAAHIAHDTAAATFGRDRLASLDAEVTAAQWTVKNIDDQLATLNTAATAAATKGRTNAVRTFQASEKAGRDQLTRQRSEAAGKLAGLAIERATLETKRMELDAETGPLVYLAALFGTTDLGATVRGFTLILAILPDLFAVFLVMAAESKPARKTPVRRKVARRKPKPTKPAAATVRKLKVVGA